METELQMFWGCDRTGALWLYPRTAQGAWAARVQVGHGWTAINTIFQGPTWIIGGNRQCHDRHHTLSGPISQGPVSLSSALVECFEARLQVPVGGGGWQPKAVTQGDGTGDGGVHGCAVW